MEQNSCSLVLRLFGPQLDQVTQVLRTGLGLLGVSAPERM